MTRTYSNIKIVLGLTVTILVLLLYIFNEPKLYDETVINEKSIKIKHNYLLEVNSKRINQLFRVLQNKESQYSQALKDLDLILFSELVENPFRTDRNVYNIFQNDIDKYLKMGSNSQIQVNENFVEYLKTLSESNTHENRRKVAARANLTEEDLDMVIVTAADKNYYRQLQATVYYVHQYLPMNRLIVYDLGLNPEMLEKTKNNCKCEIRSLNNLTNLKHVFELKKYAWKPIVVQDAFKKFDHIMYIDSSISFKSSEMSPVIRNSKKLGVLTQWIPFNITCYTNWKMFDWFNESGMTFQDIWSIDANFIIFYKNFINTLIMKAWVTCALDPDCIAPVGSRLSSCCGCHRYDQDALTILCTYFFNMPYNNESAPAFVLTADESYFHSVDRGHAKDYFH